MPYNPIQIKQIDLAGLSGFVAGAGTVFTTGNQTIQGDKTFLGKISFTGANSYGGIYFNGGAYFNLDGALYDNLQVIVIDPYNRMAYSSDSQLSIDWGNRLLQDTPGNPTLDWNNGLLYNGVNTVLDWKNQIISGNWVSTAFVNTTGTQSISGTKTVTGLLILSPSGYSFKSTATLGTGYFGGNTGTFYRNNLPTLSPTEFLAYDNLGVSSINWNTREISGNWTSTSFVNTTGAQIISGTKTITGLLVISPSGLSFSSINAAEGTGWFGGNSGSFYKNNLPTLSPSDQLGYDTAGQTTLDWANKRLSGNWTLNGAVSKYTVNNSSTAAAPYVVSETADYYLQVNSSGGFSKVISMPDPTVYGKQYIIKDVGGLAATNAIIISGATATVRFDNVTGIRMTTGYNCVTLVSRSGSFYDVVNIK